MRMLMSHHYVCCTPIFILGTFGLTQGTSEITVTEVSKGYASMGGTFKLTFKGHSTDSISYNADTIDIQVVNKLMAFNLGVVRVCMRTCS